MKANMKALISFLTVSMVFCCVETCFAWQDISPAGKMKEEPVEPIDDEDEPAVFPESGGVELVDSFVQVQTQAVAGELFHLKEKLQLDDEWIESLKSSLTGDIKKACEDLAARPNDSGVAALDATLDAQLREAMWEKIERILPEEKNAAFEEFKDMICCLQKLRDETAINGLLVVLDDQLCLSERQIDHLRTLYSKNWDSYHNEQVGVMAIEGVILGRKVVDSIERDELQQTLSAKQFEVFERFGLGYNLASAVAGKAPMDEALDLEVVRGACNLAFDLKLAEYKDLVGITQQQMELLAMGRKGAITNVTRRFDSVLTKIDDNPDAMMNLEIMSMLMEPPISHCTGEKIWQAGLVKAFDKTQLEKIEERESARNALSTDQVVNFLVFWMGDKDKLCLTYDQHKKLVDTIKKNLGDLSMNYLVVAISIANVQKKDLQEILTDEQIVVYESVTNEWRTELEAMQADDEDAEDKLK